MATFNNPICYKAQIESGGKVFIKTEIIDESYNPSNYSHNPVVDYKDIDPGQFVIKEELDESNTGFIAQIKVEESLCYPVIVSSEQCDTVVGNTDTFSENNLIDDDCTESDEGSSHSAAPETSEGFIVNDHLTLSNHKEPRESCSKDTDENKSIHNPEVEVLDGTQMKSQVELNCEDTSDVANSAIIISDTTTDLRKRVEALIPKNLRFPIGDYKCYCCCKQFKLLSDWEDHIVQYFQTSGCFPMKMEMSRYNFYSTVKMDERGRYSCTECYNVYKSKGSLFSHFKQAHQNLQLKCAVCYTISPSYSSLQKHLNVNHDPLKKKYLKCHFCDFTFPTKNDLIKHNEIVHHSRSVFKCEHCDYVAITKYRLDRHLGNWNSRDYYHEEVVCSYCSFKTSNRKCFRRHLERRHSNNGSYSFYDNPYRSKLMIKKETLKNNLTGAEETSNKKFKCDRCEELFFSISGLKLHLTKMHPKNPESYSCRFCQEKFKAKHLNFIHINEAHLFRYRFRCDECSFMGKNEDHFRKHVFSLHIIKYYCHHCSFSASKKSQIQSHIEGVHIKMKSFKCKECKYSTYSVILFRQHVNVKHNPNPVVYTCFHCGHKNKIKHKLSQHMQTKHRNILVNKKRKTKRTS